MNPAGTTPPGTSDEAQAATWVRQMFSEIAPTYDLLNHLLSFNIDKRWRRALLERLRPVSDRADAKILDLCCGTGDVLLELRAESKARIIGADFCHPMLLATQRKGSTRGLPAILFEADAMQLPVAEGAFDAIAIAFGYRNLSHYRNALTELHRVLKPGGILAILEFSHPPGVVMRSAYTLYSRVVLPAAGAIISGSRQAYTYLPQSVSKFPPADTLRDMFTEAGFQNSKFVLMTGGIAALYSGVKA